MAGMDFPASPVSGQIYDPGTGTLYKWNGAQWDVITGAAIMVIRQQVFTANGTYTPHPNMIHCIIECVGGGGSGGGVIGAAGQQTNGSGGGGGAYSKKYATRAQIGTSQPVIVGAGAATGGWAGGTSGGRSSLGTLCAANGGGGGAIGQSGVAISPGGAGGTIDANTFGDFCITGGDGGGGQGSANNFLFCGWGGASFYGGERTVPLAANGTTGRSIGGGGSGAQSLAASNYSGGPGANGIVVIQEYCTS
jgi:hypothetical protein